MPKPKVINASDVSSEKLYSLTNPIGKNARVTPVRIICTLSEKQGWLRGIAEVDGFGTNGAGYFCHAKAIGIYDQKYYTIYARRVNANDPWAFQDGGYPTLFELDKTELVLEESRIALEIKKVDAHAAELRRRLNILKEQTEKPDEG